MNRVAGAVLVVLSLILLGDVASGVVSPQQPPPTDEGTQPPRLSAHRRAVHYLAHQ